VVEDYGVQPMADASPPKWHLAHTSWFFETFLLKPCLAGYSEFHPAFEMLFNSYYNGVGNPFPRLRRGHLSRPSVAEVYDYRHHVDEAMVKLLESAEPDIETRATLGLHHEQQHQELLLTDIKFNFGHNPLYPVYQSATVAAESEVGSLTFIDHQGGLVEIGADPAGNSTSRSDFRFDNECPRHRVYLAPFALADRVITCEEYLAFMADGGYRTFSLWLSDGWTWVQGQNIQAPLYWTEGDDGWLEYRLSGLMPVGGPNPVTHVSYYEADAFARWAGYRLPSEAEWEVVAASEMADDVAGGGNFLESGHFHPVPRQGKRMQLFGDVWEWTASPYTPYPGYAPLPGALGEYNGKFMSNQQVLRGGSCVTAASHMRATYRNFFYPPDRWQFTGIRLAKNGG